MHPLVTVGEHSFAFMCFVAWSFQEMYQRKKQCSKSFAFSSHLSCTHNAVNGLHTVSSGDVKQSLLNERMLVAL